MKEKKAFPINDFAKFARTTRDTLLYYDKIGLLSPASRGDNNYRYYSGEQLAVVNLIRTFQALGMSLNEIKYLKDNRDPRLVSEIFGNQIKRLDDEIDTWVRARKLLYRLHTTITSQLDIDETAITIQYRPAEAIILGELNDYSQDNDDYDALLSFYYNIQKKYPDMDLNYPVWAVFSEKRIRQMDWKWPDRYYFNNPDGYDKKPAALYAIGYTHGGYGQTYGLWERLIKYIDDNGFEICGPAYEDYPLNELCISDDKNYLIRVTITVRAKNSDESYSSAD